MKNPCDPNCEERSGTCHGTCERYFAYYQYCRQKNAERIARNAGDAQVVESANYHKYMEKARKAPKKFLHR